MVSLCIIIINLFSIKQQLITLNFKNKRSTLLSPINFPFIPWKLKLLFIYILDLLFLKNWLNWCYFCKILTASDQFPIWWNCVLRWQILNANLDEASPYLDWTLKKTAVIYLISRDFCCSWTDWLSLGIIALTAQ